MAGGKGRFEARGSRCGETVRGFKTSNLEPGASNLREAGAASRLHAILVAASLAVATVAGAQEPAIQAPLAAKALVLDIVQAGDRLVAVGDRGHVLYSTDGHDWTQAEVPVQALLTAVAYSDAGLWAVGHDATIIHSSDGGEIWGLQHYHPELEQPLLDVHFFNASEGVAVGAYGLIMKTGDGGRTWDQAYMSDVLVSEAIEWPGPEADPENEIFGDPMAADDNEYYDAAADFDRGCYEFMECHLNALAAPGSGPAAGPGDGRLVIAGERGYGFRSTDRGETWESFRFAYTGSMFGIVAHGECLTAFGLRGHVQQSCDFGDSWELLDTATQSSLMGGTVLADGRIVMVGTNSEIVAIDPDGSIRHRSHPRGGDLAMVTEKPGGLIVVGEDGIRDGD